MAPTYSFPILGNNEIIACLGELDVPLTEQDLLKPHPDTLYRAYEEIVTLLCGETRDEMYAPDLDAADVLEFPELYEDAIGNLKFQRNLFELMRRCGVPDFTLKDLVKPEYTRTRRNISAVINFAKFREERVAAREETQAEHEAAASARLALEAKNAELKAKIKRLESARDAEKPLVDETAAELDALRADARRVEGERDDAAARKRAADEALASASASADAAEREVEAARGAVADLESKLVSPEAVGELERLTRRCAEEQVSLDEETANARALEAKAEGMRETTREAAKLTEYIEEVLVDHGKKKEASKKLKEAKAKLAAMEERQFEAEARVETLKRQEANFEEKMARLKNQGELKKQAAEASLKAAREELAAVEARRAANGARAAEESNQAETLRRKMEKQRAEHAKDIETLLKNFGSLREQVSAYHAQLADAMDIAAKERVPLAQVNGGEPAALGGAKNANGDFTNTYQWTNYDTVHFGGIGKGKPSMLPPHVGADEEFTMSGP